MDTRPDLGGVVVLAKAVGFALLAGCGVILIGFIGSLVTDFAMVEVIAFLGVTLLPAFAAGDVFFSHHRKVERKQWQAERKRLLEERDRRITGE